MTDQPQPEHLADDIAAAHKAADDLLDALHTIRRECPSSITPAPVRDAIGHAEEVYDLVRLSFPKLVQP